MGAKSSPKQIIFLAFNKLLAFMLILLTFTLSSDPSLLCEGSPITWNYLDVGGTPGW